MSEPTLLLAAGLTIVIAMAVAVLVLWRVRAHQRARADAEARMAAAMEELQLLASRLRAQKEAQGDSTQDHPQSLQAP